MDFASPGMSLTNRSTWEAIMHGRAGVMPSPMAGGTPLMSVYGGGGAMIPTPTGAPMSGTPMSGGGLRPIALANSLAVLGKRGAAEGGRDVDVMPPPPSRARVDDVAERKARWERAETAAAAHLKRSPPVQTRRRGEGLRAAPQRRLRQVVLITTSSSPRWRSWTRRRGALLRTVEPAVAAILQVQDSEFDMFDDLSVDWNPQRDRRARRRTGRGPVGRDRERHPGVLPRRRGSDRRHQPTRRGRALRGCRRTVTRRKGPCRPE